MALHSVGWGRAEAAPGPRRGSAMATPRPCLAYPLGCPAFRSNRWAHSVRLGILLGQGTDAMVTLQVTTPYLRPIPGGPSEGSGWGGQVGNSQRSPRCPWRGWAFGLARAKGRRTSGEDHAGVSQQKRMLLANGGTALQFLSGAYATLSMPGKNLGRA